MSYKVVTSPSFLEWMSQSIRANRGDGHYLRLASIRVTLAPVVLFVQHTKPDLESRHLRGQPGGLQAVLASIDPVLQELSLVAQHLNLVLDAAEGVLVPSEPLQLHQGCPVVQLGHSFPKIVEVLGRASEHVVEPRRHDLNRIEALIVGGGVQVDNAGLLSFFLPCQ